MRKKKLTESHGKVEGSQPTMLEQVWGFNELSKYGTLDEAEYKQRLDEMNRTDLETHARKIGVVIVESSARLQDKLLQEFRNYVFYLRKPAPKVQTQSQGKVSDEVRRILAEGK
jgi:hypothetical protein